MKFLTTLSFFLLTVTLNAQNTILLEEDSVSQVYENVDISNWVGYVSLDLVFANITNDSIFVNWRREFGENCPLEWDVVTQDVIGWLPNVNESPFPIPLAPNHSNFILRQDFYHDSVSGCCDIKMIFSLDGAPDNPIDTGYYRIEINPEVCDLTSVFEADTEELNIYPNPALYVINFENNSMYESIEIFDLKGKIYYQDIYSNSTQINISSFPPGIYICKIKSQSGILIKKILKQ